MKAGFLVEHLGPSQLAYYLIRNANRHLKDNPLDDVFAFYSRLVRPCLQLRFAAMQTAEAWGFDGPLVATSLRSAGDLLRFPSASRRLFYVWDLEWVRMKTKSFEALRAVYGHPDLTLVARSDGHARLLQNLWNRPVAAVVEDFDMAAFLPLLT